MAPRAYAVILEARQRGETERLVALAHQVEAMARQKKLKPLDDYLKPIRRRSPRRRPNNNALVIAHLERIAERKKSDGG